MEACDFEVSDPLCPGDNASYESDPAGYPPSPICFSTSTSVPDLKLIDDSDTGAGEDQSYSGLIRTSLNLAHTQF